MMSGRIARSGHLPAIAVAGSPDPATGGVPPRMMSGRIARSGHLPAIVVAGSPDPATCPQLWWPDRPIRPLTYNCCGLIARSCHTVILTTTAGNND